MRLTRVYVAEPLAGRGEISLPEAASNHLTRVLRLQQGAAVRLFDGCGGEYDAVIRAARRKAAAE